MYSEMAKTKRHITRSPSQNESYAEKAKFYLPRSLYDASNVEKIDEIILQRKVTSNGRTHFSYSVRWKHLPKLPFDSTLEYSEKRTRQRLIEDELSKDFYQMCLLDNFQPSSELGQNADDNHALVYDRTFTDSTDTSPMEKDETSLTLSKNKRHEGKKRLSGVKTSVNAQMPKELPPALSVSSHVGSDQTSNLTSSTCTSKSSLPNLLKCKTSSYAFKFKKRKNNEKYHLSSSSDATESKCRSLQFSATPKCHGLPASGRMSAISPPEITSSACLSEILIELITMEVMQDGTLQTVTLGDHICSAMNLLESIAVFAGNYKCFKNLRECKRIYVGSGFNRIGLDSQRYKFADEHVKRTKLCDIADGAGFLRIYAFGSIR